ncbi:hypothetical protein AMTR_s00060p00039830 [Amborella trichopoda]|uniref:DUF834 domain-containing protein n=1 Tax=Amborella trichopoda TaxID=13333 RepID=W1NK27_AMBTC|nr:hypothetical protein AMTR_s00060p00039830 [Amborella trichopoda]
MEAKTSGSGGVGQGSGRQGLAARKQSHAKDGGVSNGGPKEEDLVGAGGKRGLEIPKTKLNEDGGDTGCSPAEEGGLRVRARDGGMGTATKVGRWEVIGVTREGVERVDVVSGPKSGSRAGTPKGKEEVAGGERGGGIGWGPVVPHEAGDKVEEDGET